VYPPQCNRVEPLAGECCKVSDQGYFPNVKPPNVEFMRGECLTAGAQEIKMALTTARRLVVRERPHGRAACGIGAIKVQASSIKSVECNSSVFCADQV
jgi:hypothetical protein